MDKSQSGPGPTGDGRVSDPAPCSPPALDIPHHRGLDGVVPTQPEPGLRHCPKATRRACWTLPRRSRRRWRTSIEGVS